jgi:hypothetical protein
LGVGLRRSTARHAGKSLVTLKPPAIFFDPRKPALSVLSAVRFWVFVQSGDIRIHEHRRKDANSEQLRRFAAVMMVIAAATVRS